MMHIKKIVTIGAILLITWLVQSNVSFAQTEPIVVTLKTLVADDSGVYLFSKEITADSTATTSITTQSGPVDNVSATSIAGIIQLGADFNEGLSNPVFTDDGSLASTSEFTSPLSVYTTFDIGLPVAGDLKSIPVNDADIIYVVSGSLKRINANLSATTAIATLPLSIVVETLDIASIESPNAGWSPTDSLDVAVFKNDGSVIATSTTAVGTGIATFYVSTPGSYIVNFADKSGIDFPVVITNAPTDQVKFTIRSGVNILHDAFVPLPTVGTTTINGYEVNTQSVSAVLSTLATSSPITSISFAHASSTYLDSITTDSLIPLPWFYAINGVMFPIDSNESLSGGEDVYFLNAAQFHTTFSATTVATGTPVEITFEIFDVSNMSADTYVPEANIDIAAFASTSNIVATTTTEIDGVASFIFNTPGTYRIAKIIDGYENGTDITVLDSSSTTTPTTTDPGTGTGTTTQTSFATDLAVNFLINNRATSTVEQKEWNAIAFSVVSPNDIHGATNQTAFNSEKTFLASFLKTGELSGTEPRDLARRILALLAIGENPYTAGSVDRVANLVSMFNGTSFGTGPTTSVTTVDNAYAVLALKNAGYTISEPMMQTAIASIKSEQALNGSWNGGFNATAIALEALSLESTTSPEAIKAKEYLEQEQNPGNAAWSTNDEATTARVLLSLFAVGVQDSNLTQSSLTPLSYLADKQGKETGQDGSVGNMTSLNERITATALTIIAMTEKSLDVVISDTSKPVVAATTTPSTTPSSSSGGGRSSMSQNAPAPVTTPSQDVLRFIESRTGLKGNTMIFVGTVSQPQVRTTPTTPKKTVIVATAPQQKPIIALGTTTPSTTPATQNIAGVGAADTRGFFATLGSRMKNGFKMLLSPIFSN